MVSKYHGEIYIKVSLRRNSTLLCFFLAQRNQSGFSSCTCHDVIGRVLEVYWRIIVL